MIRVITESNLEKSSDVQEAINQLIEKKPGLRALFQNVLGAELMNYVLGYNDKQFLDREMILSIARQILITKDEMNARYRPAFTDHYYSRNGAAISDLTITWPALRGHIHSSPNPSKVAFHLVHRYSTEWFLSAQRIVLKNYGVDVEYISDKYWFDIQQAGDAANASNMQPAGLQHVNGYWYDQNYFDQVASADNYSQENRVQSVILPGREFQVLLDHNIETYQESEFSIRFASISYQVDNINESLVEYPHCIAVYLLHNGRPLLESGDVIAAAPFKNRGANYDTLCPPGCSKYHWPDGLPR